MKPGVAVLPIGDDGTVYLIRVFRYTIGRHSIEAIAGGIDAGETPADAARRALREEGGIEAAAIVDLGKTDQTTEVVAVPLAEALEWAMDGTITHAASMALLFKAARVIERGCQAPS